MNIANTSVGISVRALIDMELVIESPSLLTKKGRPTGLLSLNPNGAYFIGVELCTDRTQLAILDMKGDAIVCNIALCHPCSAYIGISSEIMNIIHQALTVKILPAGRLFGVMIAYNERPLDNKTLTEVGQGTAFAVNQASGSLIVEKLSADCMGENVKLLTQHSEGHKIFGDASYTQQSISAALILRERLFKRVDCDFY
ncbi:MULTISPECIES: hypothetical protein [unclassified Phyllobacterium]|uniref:hypothetical protein n=1 Tax=unclassified Phyllobacterium TaxID=2638441 RepID=UPI003012A16B